MHKCAASASFASGARSRRREGAESGRGTLLRQMGAAAAAAGAGNAAVEARRPEVVWVDAAVAECRGAVRATGRPPPVPLIGPAVAVGAPSLVSDAEA